MIFRRFGLLSSRLLLDQQDELRCLENDLGELDKFDAEEDPRRNWSRNVSEEDSKERRDLLDRIREEYCKYGTSNIQVAFYNQLILHS
jgi:hypothetical protein